MRICNKCYIPMASVMSFSKKKHERFYRCPKCYGETRHQIINDNELDFVEELKRAINNVNN